MNSRRRTYHQTVVETRADLVGKHLPDGLGHHVGIVGTRERDRSEGLLDSLFLCGRRGAARRGWLRGVGRLLGVCRNTAVFHEAKPGIGGFVNEAGLFALVEIREENLVFGTHGLFHWAGF